MARRLVGSSISLTFLVVVRLSWILAVHSADVLLLGGLGEGSHFLAQVPIARSLVQRGHNVTFLISEEYSHRADDAELSRLFAFEIFPFAHPELSGKAIFREVAEIGFSDSVGIQQFFKAFNAMNRLYIETCKFIMRDRLLMKRLKSVDVIVVDITSMCGYFIKSYLMRHSNVSNLKLVLTAPTTPISGMISMSGSPFNPSYMPTGLTGYTASMTFMERVGNTVAFLSVEFLSRRQMRLYAEIVNEFDLHPEFSTSLSSFNEFTDLFLTNSDFAVEFPLSFMPNFIAVGGLTTGPAKPLEGDLESFMQSSSDEGVIIFTLGTYFVSFTASNPERLQMFLDAFNRLPQKVIIQLKQVPGFQLHVPPNVKVLPWLPQNDLLGHHKTRVFLFHGGNNGFQEALYHGVPMVVIPFFADQIDVSARVVSHGLGVTIDKKKISATVIYERLKEVLDNPTYRKTAKRFSAIFRDRPMRPADRAAFWIEHVTTHGSDHLRSPAFELSFIQYHLIDVLSFFALLCAISVYILYRLLKCCIVTVCGSSKVKSKDKHA